MAAEITEEYTDSVELVEQPVAEVGEIVTREPASIYEPAYWERDAERLAALYEPYRGMRPQDLSPAEKDRLIGALWKEHWVDHQVNKQLALRIGELSVQMSGLLEPKAPRKRAARVPKAALPSLGSAEVDSNAV